MKFGWLPKNHSYESSTLRIQTLPEFQDSVSNIQNSAHIYEDWFYPPIKGGNRSPDEPIPPVPVPWFSLPLTHNIEFKHRAASSVFNEFIITIFGWSQGLRLIPEGWGHFYRVATKPGQLTDFILPEGDVPRLLDLAEGFWHRHQPDGVAATMFGAVHWYLFSHSYSHYFERFMMQYTVFDTIYNVQKRIFGVTSRTHALRFKYMADSLEVTLPSWGEVDSDRESEISKLRNDLIHEAKFAGAPIGFAFPEMNGNILVQLEAFNCRLIAAQLGARGRYSRSSCQTRQRYKFHFD
jgi:hypothetical protein